MKPAGDMGWTLEVGCHHSHSFNAGSVGWLEGRQTFQHQGFQWDWMELDGTNDWDGLKQCSCLGHWYSWYLEPQVQRLWSVNTCQHVSKQHKETNEYSNLYLHSLSNHYCNSVRTCDSDVTLHYYCPFEGISISRCFQGLEQHQWSYTAISGVAAQCLGAVAGVIPDGFLGVKVELPDAKVRFLAWNYVWCMYSLD